MSSQWNPSQNSRRVSCFDEWWCHSGGLSEEARGYDFQSNVQFSTGYHSLGRTAFGNFVYKMHSREENHPSRPVKLSRPGPSCHVVLPWVSNATCEMHSCPYIDLFPTWADTKLPFYVSQVPDSVAWKQGAFQHPWNNLIAYAFTPFALLRRPAKSVAFNKSHFGPGSSSLALKVVVCRSAVPSGGKTSWASLAVESSGPAALQEASQRSGDTATSHTEVVKWLVHEAGFSKEVAKVISLDFRRSTSFLYQGKLSRYLHWCQGGISLHARPLFCK